MLAENYFQDRSNPQYLHVCIEALHLSDKISDKKIYKMSLFLKPNLKEKQLYFHHSPEFKHYKGKPILDKV